MRFSTQVQLALFAAAIGASNVLANEADSVTSIEARHGGPRRFRSTSVRQRDFEDEVDLEARTRELIARCFGYLAKGRASQHARDLDGDVVEFEARRNGKKRVAALAGFADSFQSRDLEGEVDLEARHRRFRQLIARCFGYLAKNRASQHARDLDGDVVEFEARRNGKKRVAALAGFADSFQSRDLEDEIDLEARTRELIARCFGYLAKGRASQHARDLDGDVVEFEARRNGKKRVAALAGFADSFQSRDLEGEVELEARGNGKGNKGSKGSKNGGVIAESLGRIAGGIVAQHVGPRELDGDMIELEARRNGKGSKNGGLIAESLGRIAGGIVAQHMGPREEQAREFDDSELEARRVEELEELMARYYTDLD